MFQLTEESKCSDCGKVAPIGAQLVGQASIPKGDRWFREHWTCGHESLHCDKEDCGERCPECGCTEAYT